MVDGKVMTYAYQFSRAGRGYPSNVLTTSRRTAIRGPDWTFRRVKMGTSTILVDEATIPNKLHSLDIQSSMLLLPPLSHWTLSVLAVITSLTISHISLAGHMWTALLPTVAQYASGIEELRIAGCPDITIDDLVAFLALLPNLRILILSDEEQYIPGPSAPVPKLTELVRVEAPWRILLHIVQGPSAEFEGGTDVPQTHSKKRAGLGGDRRSAEGDERVFQRAGNQARGDHTDPSR